jgi:hypothetical protein
MKKINLLAYLVMALNVLDLNAQYCTTPLGGSCTNRPISDVSMANMVNAANGCNSASGSTYSNFTLNPALIINVVAGQSYYLKAKVSGALTAKLAAWIDWNQNASFVGSAEFYPICASGCLSDSILITVPLTAFNGNTRLRIRSKSTTASNYSAGQSCSFSSASSSGGETEDYTLNISGGLTPPPYCQSEPAFSSDDDIGIFEIDTFTNKSIVDADSLALFNPSATGAYSDFTNLSPIPLFNGLSSSIKITQVNEDIHYPCFAKVWIDFNHDSIFQNPAELVFTSAQSQNPISSLNGNVLGGIINVPAFAASIIDTGITRLRIVLSQQDSVLSFLMTLYAQAL